MVVGHVAMVPSVQPPAFAQVVLARRDDPGRYARFSCCSEVLPGQLRGWISSYICYSSLKQNDLALSIVPLVVPTSGGVGQHQVFSFSSIQLRILQCQTILCNK